MAITAIIERKTELGMVAALKGHADLVALNASPDFIRRYADSTKASDLPAVLVLCQELRDPSPTAHNFYIVPVQIIARTLRKTDPDKSVIEDMVGGIRDALLTGAAFITAFETVGQVDVLRIRNPPNRSINTTGTDGPTLRTRTIHIEVLLSAVA